MWGKSSVATAPTACGIETMQQRALAALNQYNVATAPTACGIETPPHVYNNIKY